MKHCFYRRAHPTPSYRKRTTFFWNSLLKKTFSIAFERSWWVANFSKAFRESSSSKFYHVLHFNIFEILNHLGFYLKSKFLTNKITIKNISKIVQLFFEFTVKSHSMTKENHLQFEKYFSKSQFSAGTRCTNFQAFLVERREGIWAKVKLFFDIFLFLLLVKTLSRKSLLNWCHPQPFWCRRKFY